MIFWAALTLALTDPAPLAAASDQPVETESQISLAEAGRAIAAGRLDQARRILGIALAAGVKGEPVDRLLADLAYASGDYHQALQLYRTLLTNNPNEVLLLERAGIAALRLRQTDEATSLLDRATRQPGAGWRAWNARGVAADREGRWAEADAAYAHALELDASHAEIHNNMGWSLMLRGLWSEALASFERAAQADPDLPRLKNNIELARAALSAELPYRLAGESDEAYAARLNDAGVVAASAGQSDKAKAAFAQAIEVRSRWYAKAAENLAALGKTE